MDRRMQGCLQMVKNTNVQPPHPTTTRLHQGILPCYRHLSLWCGHCTLTRGRNQSPHPQTHALPCHLLLSYIHSHTMQLQHLWARIPRSIHAAHEYRPHLAATEIPVTILTNHANLLHWKSPWKVNQWVAWWFSDLQDFNLIFKHVPGKIHAAPDMLSWPPRVDKGEHDNEVVTLIPERLFINTIATPSAI